ncbi:hypothetical protein PM082_009994 [Marasmius tenuissimus]|nr:hypothetical protein PM082_009994 [Marasmius tenuissimus]
MVLGDAGNPMNDYHLRYVCKAQWVDEAYVSSVRAFLHHPIAFALAWDGMFWTMMTAATSYNEAFDVAVGLQKALGATLYTPDSSVRYVVVESSRPALTIMEE